MNRYREDGSEISPTELQAELERLHAKPAYQAFLKTGLCPERDTVTDGNVMIGSRTGRELGRIRLETFNKLVALVGPEEARSIVCEEGQFAPDWEAYVGKLGRKL